MEGLAGLHDVEEVAMAIGVSKMCVRVWKRIGWFPPPDRMIGRKMFWTDEALEKAKALACEKSVKARKNLAR